MPWQTPTLKQVREMVRDDVTTSLQGAAVVGNTVLRVMSDATAGLARLILKYIDWLARQLMPDTAETEWLDRHGQIWIVNADGSLGRKSPAPTQGTIAITGIAGVQVPEASELVAANGWLYETLEFKTLTNDPVEVAVRAINAGSAGNIPAGSPLAFTTPARITPRTQGQTLHLMSEGIRNIKSATTAVVPTPSRVMFCSELSIASAPTQAVPLHAISAPATPPKSKRSPTASSKYNPTTFARSPSSPCCAGRERPRAMRRRSPKAGSTRATR